MRILIFGCGYLGKRVAEAWIASGNEVFALTRSSSHVNGLEQMGIHPLVGDVCDLNSLSDVPVADIVLYAVGYDRNSARTREEVTCTGLQNAVTSINGKVRQFIYISSTSVYGQTNGELVDESSETKPTQSGGQLSLTAEQLIQNSFPLSSAVRVNIVRLAGIYGPDRLLSRVESLRANAALSGRGDAWLNLIHVDDAVSAILACASKGKAGEIYNVVDNQPLARRDYFGLLAQLVHATAPTFDPNVPHDRGSGGLNKRCSNRKIRECLDWSPRYASIATGLPQAVSNLLNR